MGFLKKMIIKAIAEEVGYTVISDIDNHMKNTRSVDAIVQNSSAKYKLIIKKKAMSSTRCFWVSRDEQRLYLIKTEAMTFGLPCIRLYDLNDNELGKIQTERSTTTKASMRKYGVYVDGEKLGILNQSLSFKKKLDFDLNGWRIEGNGMHNQFVIYNRDGHQIIKINDTYSDRDTYVIELDNRENEIMGLLMLMALEISMNGKFS